MIGDVTRTVAANVRDLRQFNGWRLADLSDCLTASGWPMSLKTLSKLETCTREITVDDVAALADVLGVSVDHLMGRARAVVTRTSESFT